MNEQNFSHHLTRLSLVLTLTLSTAGQSLERPEVLEAGSGHAWLTKEWVAYLVEENRVGADLNGDGDREDSVVAIYDFATNEETMLPYAVEGLPRVWFSHNRENRISFPVSEQAQGEDLDGNGSIRNSSLHVHDLRTGETTNLKTGAGRHGFAAAPTDFAILKIHESDTDLNGDGDLDDPVMHVQDIASGVITNLRIAAYSFGSRRITHTRIGHRVLFLGWERAQVADLNGDGDQTDLVLHFHDLDSGKTTNLGIAIDVSHGSNVFAHQDGDSALSWTFSGDRVSIPAYEVHQGRDFNGDGDTRDTVLQTYSFSTDEWTNFRLTTDTVTTAGDWIALNLYEFFEQEDLNGDGDTLDVFVRVINATSRETLLLPYGARNPRGDGDWIGFVVRERDRNEDVNGDGDAHDSVLHAYNVKTRDIKNLKHNISSTPQQIGWFVVGNHALLRVSELNGNGDLNGDDDIQDTVNLVIDLESYGLARFTRGDSNSDGNINLSDAVFTLNYLFLAGAAPACLAASDSNADARLNLSDATYLLNSLFRGGPTPANPFADCGPSELESDRTIGCDTSSCR